MNASGQHVWHVLEDHWHRIVAASCASEAALLLQASEDCVQPYPPRLGKLGWQRAVAEPGLVFAMAYMNPLSTWSAVESVPGLTLEECIG